MYLKKQLNTNPECFAIVTLFAHQMKQMLKERKKMKANLAKFILFLILRVKLTVFSLPLPGKVVTIILNYPNEINGKVNIISVNFHEIKQIWINSRIPKVFKLNWNLPQMNEIWPTLLPQQEIQTLSNIKIKSNKLGNSELLFSSNKIGISQAT